LRRICLGDRCVLLSSNEYRLCLGFGPLELSLAASCLLPSLPRGAAEALRNLVNDYYALCSLYNDYVMVGVGGLGLLVPRGCLVTGIERGDGLLRVVTDCGIEASCRRVA
jgi:hypothetical protein